MKIGLGAQLLSYPRAQSGGLGTYMRGLLTALPPAAHERGHELHVFWGAEGPALMHHLGLVDPHVVHHLSRLPMSRRLVRIPWEQAVLPLLTLRHGLDVFHSPDHVLPILIPSARTVVTMHDAIPIRMPETFTGMQGRYKNAMTRLAVRRATRIIADSRATHDDLRDLLHVPSERIRVVPLGLSAVFQPRHDRAGWQAVQERYGLPGAFLVYVGRLEPRKNVDGIIQGYALARERWGVTMPLVLMGKLSWMYEDTLRLPARLGIEDHVRIVTNFVADADLPYIYSRASALIFPSLYEGFGLPILEALACGTLVVTSTSSSMPELAGGLGVLVDPRDPSAIAAGIDRVLVDTELRARVAREGPEWARQFTWERTARETIAVYEEAMR